MNTRQERREAKINAAAEAYAHALTQARLVPSMYTRRELKRANQRLKVAQMPPLVTYLAVALVVAALLLWLVVWAASHTEGGSTGWNEAEERAQEQCRAATMQQLDEAGIDRPLTEGELAMCADPESRKLLGLEGDQ